MYDRLIAELRRLVGGAGIPSYVDDPLSRAADALERLETELDTLSKQFRLTARQLAEMGTAKERAETKVAATEALAQQLKDTCNALGRAEAERDKLIQLPRS